MSLNSHKFIEGELRMRPWNVLVEASIQGVKVQGTITCHTGNEESAKKLARMTFINQLRKVGIWAHIDEIDEPYEIETDGPVDKKTGKVTKKKEIKYKKVTRYLAPYWEHVKASAILDLDERDLTFPMEELEKTAIDDADISMSRTKRRTTPEVALAKREKKQAQLSKKEEQLEKAAESEIKKQNKIELFQIVESYFSGSDAKSIKVAADELGQIYQNIRWALFKIKNNGYNGMKYDLIETEIKGKKAFRLVKKTK